MILQLRALLLITMQKAFQKFTSVEAKKSRELETVYSFKVIVESELIFCGLNVYDKVIT